VKIFIYSFCEGRFGYYIRASSQEEADRKLMKRIVQDINKMPCCLLRRFTVDEEELDEAEKQELDKSNGIWFFTE